MNPDYKHFDAIYLSCEYTGNSSRIADIPAIIDHSRRVLIYLSCEYTRNSSRIADISAISVRIADIFAIRRPLKGIFATQNSCYSQDSFATIAYTETPIFIYQFLKSQLHASRRLNVFVANE